MTRFRFFAFILLLLLAGLTMPVHAQASIQVVGDAASPSFPESLLFQAEFKSAANITSVVLQYGVNQLTCGTVEAEAFPDLTPGTDVKVQWTWEMRQSAMIEPLAPGATVWWRWQVSDASGAQFTSPQKSVLWLDNVHPWQVITGGSINLHYYNGGASFGKQLHDAAVSALNRLSQDVGVSTDSPVDIYIYASQSDLLQAVLYDPSWADGQAFADNNIVIIGVSSNQLDFGKTTEAHELTHVLVGHLTFTCLGLLPHWLDEGLAAYGQGGRADYTAALNQGVASNTLMSLRSLTGNFPADPAQSVLAYGESNSVVTYLLKTYGRAKMTALLLDLKDGQTADQALQAVYSVDTDGLEDAWRTFIGAKPRPASAKVPLATPTQVPTFIPIGAASVAQAATSLPQPTMVEATAVPSAAIPTLPQTPPAKKPAVISDSFLTILEIALACVVVALILAGLAVFLIVRSQNRRGK